MQDINLDQFKLKVNDSYKNDEKITTNFETSIGKDAINKAYLDERLSKIDGHISLLEQDYNEIKLLSDKQFIEEVLIQKVVKSKVQVL